MIEKYLDLASLLAEANINANKQFIEGYSHTPRERNVQYLKQIDRFSRICGSQFVDTMTRVDLPVPLKVL